MGPNDLSRGIDADAIYLFPPDAPESLRGREIRVTYHPFSAELSISFDYGLNASQEDMDWAWKQFRDIFAKSGLSPRT